MNQIFQQLGLLGIVPVISIDDAGNAEPLGRALVDGGLPCAEVTFRTSAAQEAIARLAKAFPTMLVGAGTVLTVDQVKRAVDAGARFVVSPGINRTVVEYCVQQKIPVIPGVATPTEIQTALELKLEAVKFFPAEASGGVEYLKAMSAPFRQLLFIPTGGIDESNFLLYLKFPAVLACGGSWMVKADLIATKRFDEIQKLAEQAVFKMLGFQFSHLGINNAGADEAKDGAVVLSRLLHLTINDGESSLFVGKQFELLKRQYLGRHGHIAIGTNFIERAVAYCARQGVRAKDETKSEKNGRLRSIYLEIDIGGFAVHLLQLE